MTRTIKFYGIMFLFVASLLCLYVLSNHAIIRGSTQRWSATNIFDAIDESIYGKGPCKTLIVAACPNAIIHDYLSPNYGELSPQIKVFCKIGDKLGLMGIYSMITEIKITAFPVREKTFYKLCNRDNCNIQNITWFQNFIGAVVR